MKATSSAPGSTGINLLKKNLFYCGILSSILYVAMNIFMPLLWEGYNSASQTVSELSAIGTPTRAPWVWLGVAYSLLVTGFGWAVRLSGSQNRRLAITGSFILAYGLTSLVWPFAPMHQREVLAAGQKTFSDTMHLILAAITVLVMLTAMGFGAMSFGKYFRYYSVVTILGLFVFGLLTALDAPKVEENLPTPYAGIWERINIGLFLAWIIVLACILLKEQNKTSVIDKIHPVS